MLLDQGDQPLRRHSCAHKLCHILYRQGLLVLASGPAMETDNDQDCHTPGRDTHHCTPYPTIFGSFAEN
jgi:hypothetical protein